MAVLLLKSRAIVLSGVYFSEFSTEKNTGCGMALDFTGIVVSETNEVLLE